VIQPVQQRHHLAQMLRLKHWRGRSSFSLQSLQNLLCSRTVSAVPSVPRCPVQAAARLHL
jgi:hypothetical protein